MSEMKIDSPENFNNRELSWLDFNARVLAEAQNPQVPLMERVKFLAIVSSNLDEFFMVRVALVQRALEAGLGALGPDGRLPAQAFSEISAKAHKLVDNQYACFRDQVLPMLADEGMELVRAIDYTQEDTAFLSRTFEESVLPVLTPMAVDTSHPFPLLTSCALYLMFKVKPLEGVRTGFYAEADTVLVQVPSVIDRFLRLPSPSGKVRLALLEDVISTFAERLLGGYSIQGAYPFRVTRDADFTVDEEQAENLLSAIEAELRSRRRGDPVRLEVAGDIPQDVLDYLYDNLKLSDPCTYRVESLLDLKSLFALPGMLDKAGLSDPAWPPRMHPLLKGRDIFEVMRERDIVLHHPYQSFDPVVELLTRAASDPEVLAIKITLYRVSGDSPLVKALVKAAQNGKQVTALVELRARFDEEANITWARRLDDAGAHVIYGVVGYKTHSKALMIVRREPEGIRRYMHLSTGNYNDRTARLYTDLGYFTSRPEIGADISAFFNVITGYSLPPKWNVIEMSPTGMRNRFLALIDREIEKHTPETPGLIKAKFNSLIDPGIISALYRASQAGVRIELVVRGMSRLRAGVKGLSENIRLISIVDRFLEHSRIYYFHNGGSEEVYCSSADWMERNLDKRLELLFPILDEKVRDYVMYVLDEALADNVKAWELCGDDVYRRVELPAGVEPLRSQDTIYRRAVDLAKAGKDDKQSQLFIAKTSPEDESGKRK